MADWYVDRVDGRVLLSLGYKPASRLRLLGDLGISGQHLTDLICPLVRAGLVIRWRKGIRGGVGYYAWYRLSELGKQRAAELALELGEEGVAKLLAPRSRNGRIITNGKAVKGKRAAKPDSLGNTFGL